MGVGILNAADDLAGGGAALTRGARQAARGADDEYIDVYRLVSSAEKEAMEMAGYRFVASRDLRLAKHEPGTTRVFLQENLQQMKIFASQSSPGLYDYLARAKVLQSGFWKSVVRPDVVAPGWNAFVVSVDVLNNHLKGRVRFRRIR